MSSTDVSLTGSSPEKDPTVSSVDAGRTDAALPDISTVQLGVLAHVEQVQEDALTLLTRDLGLEDVEIATKDDFATPEWTSHRDLHKGDWAIITKAAQVGLPEAQVKMYLLAVVAPLLQSGSVTKHTEAFRLLSNTKIASQEVCNAIGRKVVDELFTTPGYTLTDSYLASQLDKRSLVYAEAVERLRTAPPVVLPPPADVSEEDREDDDDDEDDENEQSVVTLSSKVSMKEMLDQIHTLLGEGGFERLGQELHDNVSHKIADILLIDFTDSSESVQEFCTRTYTIEDDQSWQPTLDELQDYLPVHFTD